MAAFLIIFTVAGLFIILIGEFIFVEGGSKNGIRKRIAMLGKKITGKDLRAEKRVTIPGKFRIDVKLKNEYFKRNSFTLIDISTSGMRLLLKRKIKKFPEDMSIYNSVLKTPEKPIMIKKMNIVRIESSLKSGILAFKIKEISSDQLILLEETIRKVKDFSRHGN